MPPSPAAAVEVEEVTRALAATMEGEDIRAVSTEAAPGTMPASRASIAVEIGIVRATIMATAGTGMTAGSPVTTTATGTAAPMTVISSTATSVATAGMATAANTEAASPTSGRGPVFGPALFVSRGIPGRVPVPWLASPRLKAGRGGRRRLLGPAHHQVMAGRSPSG